MQALVEQIKACSLCEKELPLGCRPIFALHPESRILLIGQAPGKKTHLSGIPWDDKSGDNLRSWLGLDKVAFYDARNIALLPMGFCYPGTGNSGDIPPRPECAPLWHPQVLPLLKKVQLTLLMGQYAQHFYLGKDMRSSLTETVQHFNEYLPRYFPLPHPSPLNFRWQAKNPWFKAEVLPALQACVQKLL